MEIKQRVQFVNGFQQLVSVFHQFSTLDLYEVLRLNQLESLLPAHFVKPYRRSNKNNLLDSEAIAEAVTKQNREFAQVKTQEQLDLQALRRVTRV